jgi:hypothetical protein
MCVCVRVSSDSSDTHTHTHVQPQFLRGGRLRRLVHACFASLLKEYEDMSAAGEARDALVRLHEVVRRRWTSGAEAHAVLCSWGKKIRDKFATDNTPVFLGGAPELRPVVELLQSMKEAINNNHNQLTLHVRGLVGKIGRLEADVQGLKVRHLCFWWLSQIKKL